MQKAWHSASYLQFMTKEMLVEQNLFRSTSIQNDEVPSFAEAKGLLPEPYWEGHEAAISCWWKAWELAWKNIRPATAVNGFVRTYIDTAFNDNLFMWDSVFILLFGRYGSRAFNFQQTLDNFYAHQHDDGFICRELRPFADQKDLFYPHDPASTGPNVLAWCEWLYFENSGNVDRVRQVFPALLAYHRWLRTYRSWPDGSYWQSGLASGMDNQPIDATGDAVHVEHRHLSRIDATAQALLSAKCLCAMAKLLNRLDETTTEQVEVERLTALINRKGWEPNERFYTHWHEENGRSPVKSIGAYWGLIAGAVPPERIAPFVGWLDHKATFNRPHRLPSLSASSPHYVGNGGYWRGGVWSPTNYMVLRGLTQHALDDLAYEIAENHHRNVVEVFKNSETLWEFYAPEQIEQGMRADGKTAVSDFVGWTGLAPIAILLEYLFGLRPNVPQNELTWDVRQLEAFGVRRYPFGKTGLLGLHCAARKNELEKPQIKVQSTRPLTVKLRWAGGEETVTPI